MPVALGDIAFGPPHAPPAIHRTGDENALRLDLATGQWHPVLDGASGAPLDFPFVLYGAPGCYADCDGSGALDIGDYICFQTRFALGDPGADCDGNGIRDIGDYVCFQTRFALGC